jgi:hypothetical protein
VITHLIVLPVSKIQERLVSKVNAVSSPVPIYITAILNLCGVHRSVNELGGLAVPNSLLLLELVEKSEKKDEGSKVLGE